MIIIKAHELLMDDWYRINSEEPFRRCNGIEQIPGYENIIIKFPQGEYLEINRNTPITVEFENNRNGIKVQSKVTLTKPKGQLKLF